MKLLILTIFTLVSTEIYAQTAKIKWQDETCEFESKFDSTRVTRIQISNCLRLAKWNEFRLTNSPMVFQPSDLQSLDSNKLYREYIDKVGELDNIDLPKTIFWQDYKTRTREAQQSYFNLSIIKYRAYYDLKALYDLPFKDSCINQHREALNSDTSALLKDWKLVRELMASQNGYPEKVISDYNRMLNSDTKMTYAKIDILNFGWWNCAIKYLSRVEDFYSQDKVQSELDALFISTKTIDCDEP